MVTRRVAWSVAIVAAFTMTVSYIDRSTLGVLAPSVTKELEISEAAYGWLASAFSIAYLISTPLGGWWIDRIGARRGLVASVLVWSSFAAAHALVPGFAVLFMLRIALGVAEGPSFPGAAQTVQRVLPPADRSRGFGVLFTGSSIGFLIVPPLASFIAEHAGWRVAFLVTSLVGLLWIPIWIVLTRRPEVRVQLDAHEAKPSGPRATFLTLLRHPLMIRGLLGIFAAAPVTGFMYAWGAKYLVREFSLKQGEVGWYLWVPALSLDVGAILSGDLAARWRRAPGAPPRALFAIGMVLATSFALLPFAETPWTSIAIIAVATAGGGAVYTLCIADLLARMPPESVSLAGGMLAGAQSLALIAMNPLVGWAVGYYQSYDAVAVTLGLWVIPGSLAWVLWKPADRFR